MNDFNRLMKWSNVNDEDDDHDDEGSADSDNADEDKYAADESDHFSRLMKGDQT